MQLTGFKDQTAFVTGAAGGIGMAAVHLLRAAGAQVFATDTAEALNTSRLPPAKPGLRWRALDVRDGPAVAAMVDEADQTLGPVSLGLHAAGVLATDPLLQTSDETWRWVFDVNTAGTFHVTRALGHHMAARGKGAIAVIGSNAGGIPRLNMGAYAASKAAAAMLTRCLGLELAAQGVRCNIVAPGSTLTPMQTSMWTEGGGAERVIAGDLAGYRTGIPLRKLATPDDIAQAAMFLLSDQAGHVTMADLYVDGGATLRA